MQNITGITLKEAVLKVYQYCADVDTKCIREYYPEDLWFSEFRPKPGVFAYQFMNKSQKNVATYIPDMETLTFQRVGGRVFEDALLNSVEAIDTFA